MEATPQSSDGFPPVLLVLFLELSPRLVVIVFAFHPPTLAVFAVDLGIEFLICAAMFGLRFRYA